jgi:hypothetical protein
MHTQSIPPTSATPLSPTFADICTHHNLDFPELATLTDISYAILDKMFYGIPVSERDASLVLGIVSLETGQKYSLDNVDVVLLAEASQTSA